MRRRKKKTKEKTQGSLLKLPSCENEFTEGIIQQCAIVRDAREICWGHTEKTLRKTVNEKKTYKPFAAETQENDI